MKPRYLPLGESILVFYDSDLPSMASHCEQSECGFSLYRGVLVQWDEDQDRRILTWIDSLSESDRENLIIAQEHKASLSLRWKWAVPEGLEENKALDIPDKEGGSFWNIAESSVLGER